MSEKTPTWHPEVLPALWPRAAADLAARGVLRGFYLAGGTGLALQFGHRRSVDLDLFCSSSFDSRTLLQRLSGLATLANVEPAENTLHFQLHGVKVSLLHYPYPLVHALRAYDGLDVADARDLACTKVETIASRGSRRDFIDLFVSARAFGLDAILDWFDAKYASVHYNRAHVLKSLTYFADAEQEPLPDLLFPLDWSTVTRFFVAEVPRLTRFSKPQ